MTCSIGVLNQIENKVKFVKQIIFFEYNFGFRPVLFASIIF
jgi:hypothetical protein